MSIVYPMGLMAIFTLLYSCFLIRTRIKALKAGDVKRTFFRTYDNDTPPDYVQKPTRHWANLFEVPVLFYAVCAAILATGLEDSVFIYLAYGFFGLRLIHAYVHTTYNKVIHRVGVFFFGMVTVFTMWVRLMWLV